MKRIVTICFGFVLLALVAPNVAMAQKNSKATKGGEEKNVVTPGGDEAAPEGDGLELLEGAVAEAEAESDAPQTLNVGFWDLFMAGGWLMWVLVLLAGVMIFIFVERFLAIRNATQIDPNFMNRIRDYISEGNIDAAVDLCRRTDSPIARMVEKGIERIGRPMGDIQTAIENVANVEVAKLESGLPWLSSISGGAPMIGFLGTVVGMVQVFIDMSANQSGTIELSQLSSGMYVAMVTTVGGLVVGIPAYFGYNYLVARIEKLIFRMEATTIAFMDILNQPVQK
jgi:biopolymer transport protein ExbB